MNAAGSTLAVNSWFRYGLTSTGVGGFNLLAGTVTTSTTQSGTNVTLGEVAGGTGFLNISAGASYFARGPALVVQIGRDNGATGTVNVAGLFSFNNSGSTRLGVNAGGVGTLNITTGGVYNSSGTAYTSIGAAGTGTLNITGTGQYLSNGDFNISDVTNSVGTVNLTGTGALRGGAFYVGKGSASSGVLNQISGTTTATGLVRIGGLDTNAGASYGVYNLSGGTTTVAGDFQTGGGGTGLLSMTGGTLTDTGGFFSTARYGTTSFGTADIAGGTVNANNAAGRVIAGEQGTGIINVRAGGVLNIASATNADANFNSSNAALSIGNTAGSTGIVNLLAGGVITTRSVGSYNPTGTTSTFDFNGGSLRTTVATTTFMQNLTHAYVYGGGAIINTSAGSATISQNLEAPGGNGVTSIPVLNGGAGYAATPTVKITGGGGTGATAVAVTSGGVVTGITVTNPGTGYTSAPTVTLVSGLFAPATAASLDNAALTANVSGSLTKNGGNTLTLSGSNSFTGGLVVNGGTLASGNASAFPQNSSLAVNSAGVNFGGQYIQPAGSNTPGLTLSGLTTTGSAAFTFGLSSAGADQVNVASAATLGSGATISLTAATGSTLAPGQYNLFTDAAGGLSNVTLATTTLTTGGGIYTFSLNATNTADILTISAAQIAKLYFTGFSGNSLSVANNFSTDAAGGNAAAAAPTGTTDLVFTANAANSGNFNTTLGGLTAANSLEFTGTGTPAGTTPVTIGGPGTLTLNAGANTFAAGTAIVVDPGAAAPTISANLNLPGSQQFVNSSANPLTISGAIGSTNAGTELTLNGNNSGGGFVLSGANTYAGSTVVTNGTVQLGSGAALGAAGNTTNVSTGGVVDLRGQQASQAALVLAGGQVVGSLGTGSLTLTAPAGSAMINVTGTGYNASVGAVTAATLNLNGGGVIAKTAATGTPVITSNVNLGAATTTIALADSPGDAAAELSLTGVIAGAGGLALANNATVAGATFANQQDFGTLLLSNANTYSGGTNISSGRVVISNGSALGTGPVTIAGANTVGSITATGGTLAFGNALYNTSIASGLIPTGITLANPVNLGGAITGNYGVGIQNNQGANTISGPVSLLQAVSVIGVNGTSLTISGNVANAAGVAGGFTKTGASPLFLSGANSFTGLATAGAGEIVPLTNGALPNGGQTAVTAGADVNVPAGVAVVGNTITVNGSGVALGGALTSNASGGAVGTWAGPVVLGSAGLTTASARVGAQAGATLVVAGPISNGSATTLDVSGLGTAGSNGSYGTLVLSGASTYTGVTNIIRGNLIVDGSALTAGQANINGSSGINVGSSGTAGEFSSLTLRNGAVVNTTGNVAVATGNQTSGSVVINPGTTLTANVVQLGNTAVGLTDTTTFTQTGGTVNALTFFSPGFSGTGNATMNLSGGTVNVRTNAASTVGELEVGVFDQQTTVLNVGAGEAINLDNNANLVVGSQNNTVANTVNQTGGTVTMFADNGATVGGTGTFIIGRGSAVGAKTYNLSGGVLTVTGVSRTAAAGTGSSTLNFNGGTLRAANSSAGFITNLTAANVLAGGAIIDTQAFNVTVNQNLSSGTAAGTVDGGLTKLGTGTLTLGGQLAYTGVTNASAGTLTFPAQNAGSGIAVRTLGGGLFVNSGAQVVVPASAATADRTVLVVSAGPIAFNGSTGTTTGKVDLNNGDLVVRNGSLANLTAAAARGFGGGTFNSGGGLTSSSAAADAAHLTAVGVIQNVGADNATALYTSFDGVAVTATDVLARLTYFGDTNLDGQVNAADFTRLDAGAVMGRTGWANGDFNYDGVVDGSDYALADNAFNQQMGQFAAPASALAGSVVASPAALVAGGASAVPEPTSVALLAVGAASVLGGRRRRRAVVAR